MEKKRGSAGLIVVDHDETFTSDDINLNEIKNLALSATQKKWVANRHATFVDARQQTVKRFKLNIQKSVLGSFDENDARFIVAVQPSVILKLIEMIEQKAS